MIDWICFTVGAAIGSLIGDKIAPIKGMTLKQKLVKATVFGLVIGTITYYVIGGI